MELARFAIRMGLSPLEGPPRVGSEMDARHRLAETEHGWEALREVEAAACGVTGRAYFGRLNEALVRVFHADACTVLEYLQNGRGTWLGRRLDALDDQVPVQTLPVRGRPTQDVLEHGFISIEKGMRERYPEIDYIQEHELDATVAVRLDDGVGRPLGMLAVASKAAIDRTREPELVLRAIAPRASSELARLRWGASVNAVA